MNVLTIAGNLGSEARLNAVQGQQGPISVANFAVAVKKRQKDQQGNYQTLWVDCSLWGTRADALAQYLQKGTRVAVTGEADVTTYTDNNGNVVPKLTLRVNEITLLGGGENNGNTAAQQPQAGGYQQPAQRPAQAPDGPSTQFDSDDSIPF